MSRRAYLPLLLLVSCLGPKSEDLFTATAGSNASAGGASGTSSTIDRGGSPSGGSAPERGGTSGDKPSGGHAGGGNDTASSGGSAGGPNQLPPESCDAIEGSTTHPDSGHCYRVNDENLSFKSAGDACRAAGGHLVTIGDEAENHFVQHLLEAEHWLGGTDGRADEDPGAGTYSWVDGENWSYTNWESGQPNAVATDCPGQSGGAHCYEHCAYEKSAGGWFDRACWHTIASVCEWDLSPKPAGGIGAAGAPPAAP